MIDPRHIRAKAAAAREAKGRPAVAPEPGEIAGGVADLIGELERNPDGAKWLDREARFRHLLHRRLEQARLRRRTRPGKPLPAARVEELRTLVTQFLAETQRLIDELPGRPVYRGSIVPWGKWVEGQFVDQGLGDVWAEIRPDLPDSGLENRYEQG